MRPTPSTVRETRVRSKAGVSSLLVALPNQSFEACSVLYFAMPRKAPKAKRELNRDRPPTVRTEPVNGGNINDHARLYPSRAFS